MSDDPRCCGTGTCIINDEGVCWCGQKWDGQKMCFPARSETSIPLAQTQQTALSQPAVTAVQPELPQHD
jgi:hypothetical protein